MAEDWILGRLDTPDLACSKPLFVFDFDCCLLPTLEIQRLGLSLDSTDIIDPIVRKELDSLGDLVVATLTQALAFGRVCIVTNAEAGWVQLTTARFFPLQTAFFASIEVYSARTLFESQGFPSPLDWKVQAFDFVISTHRDIFPSSDFQVVSIGDSLHEREAVISVCQSRGLLYKSIKMLDRPDFLALARQHVLLQKRLPLILDAVTPLDVRVHLIDSFNCPLSPDHMIDSVF